MGKRIAIVGGGYLGAELAKAMDDIADVTLIEPRSHFVHASAMIRAVVQPSLVEDSLIPYDRLLKRGRVVAARATGVDGEGVTLDSGARVDADYIVVATGSNCGPRAKPRMKSCRRPRPSASSAPGLWGLSLRARLPRPCPTKRSP